MATKSFKIWTDKILKIPWHGGSTDDAVKKEVSWDAEKTVIDGAELRLSARASGNTQIYIYMNGNEIVNIRWAPVDDMQVKGAVEDVSGVLINGGNNFEVRFDKLTLWPFDVSITFTLELIITFSGEEPDVKPWYEKYVIPMSIALGSTMVGAVATTEYARRRD